MAEPARQTNSSYDDESGKSRTRRGLRGIKGGGEGDGVPTGNLRAAEEKGDNGKHADESSKDAPNSGGRPNLQALEGGGEDDDDSLWNDSDESAPRKRRVKISGRKMAAGGGVAGLFIAVIFSTFSILQGPAQLVHLAEILQTNFFGDENSSHLRLTSLYRYARTGEVGETRVTKVGSWIVNNTRTQLTDVGIEFKTNSVNGQVRSISLDSGKLSKTYPELEGMNREQARAFLAKEFGIPESQLSNLRSDARGHKFSVNNRDFSIKATRALVKKSVSLLDDGKVISAMKTRSLAKFFDTPSLFHPLKKAAAALDKKYANRVERKARETERQKASKIPDSPKVAAAKSKLRETLSGNQGKLSAVLFATAALCIARDVADAVPTVNRAAIAVPSAFQAIDKTAIGSQVKSNTDMSMSVAGAVVEGFTDANGENIWDAKSLQATSNPSYQGGQDLSNEYKQGFSVDTTSANIKNTLDAGGAGAFACSKVGQALQLIGGLALFIAGPLTGGASWGVIAAKEGASMAATVGVITLLQKQFVNLLKSDAVVPAIFSGPVGGNLLAYGAREAANISARASGGVALSAAASAKLDQQERLQSEQEFKKKPLYAKLFDMSDYRTPISKFGDTLSPSPTRNIATMSQTFLNIPRLFSTIFSSIVPRAHAATITDYNWSFPRYGIPDEILKDSKYDDPYDNAQKVGEFLDSTGGADAPFVKQAKSCFGAEVTKGTDGWQVIAQEDVNPNEADYIDAHCDNMGDENWKRMILFVFDSRTMDAIDCYQSESETAQQSCSNVGSGGDTSSDTAAADSADTGAAVTGSAQDLAQQILDSNKITLQDNPKSSIQAAAKGDKSPAGVDKCGVQHPPVALDPKLLGFLVDLAKVDEFTITSLTTGAHACASNHYKGVAADFGCDIDTAKADRIGKKYGISHNFESCADQMPHFHYSIGGD